MPLINLANFPQQTVINVLADPGHIKQPIAIPNCIQMRINWSNDAGKSCHNVLYGSVTGAFVPTTATANAIYSGITTGATWTALVGLLSTGTSIQGVDLRDIRPPADGSPPSNPIIPSTGAPIVGTSTGSPFPSEVALTATLRTAKAGRGFRGRMFLLGWTTNSLISAGNLVAPATITAVNNWLGTLQSVMLGQGLTWALGLPERAAYTSANGTAHPHRAAIAQPITAFSVRDNHWDSQRRRGLK